MQPNQKITPERLNELRGILEKIPGSERKSWHLEVYELRDGKDYLAEVIDIKTGQVRPKDSRKSEP